MQCSIPEEILLEIFKHITRKDLVSATQVSKRWNVSSNCLLYENLFCNESTLNKGLFKTIYGSKNGGLVRQLTINASLYPIVIDMIISKCPFIVKLSFNSSSPSHQVDLAIGEMVKEHLQLSFIPARSHWHNIPTYYQVANIMKPWLKEIHWNSLDINLLKDYAKLTSLELALDDNNSYNIVDVISLTRQLTSLETLKSNVNPSRIQCNSIITRNQTETYLYDFPNHHVKSLELLHSNPCEDKEVDALVDLFQPTWYNSTLFTHENHWIANERDLQRMTIDAINKFLKYFAKLTYESKLTSALTTEPKKDKYNLI